ncbi:hypothetical protein T439DRAFT_383243 [Meredithblackwellia eburnea MCA 4105]
MSIPSRKPVPLYTRYATSPPSFLLASNLRPTINAMSAAGPGSQYEPAPETAQLTTTKLQVPLQQKNVVRTEPTQTHPLQQTIDAEETQREALPHAPSLPFERRLHTSSEAASSQSVDSQQVGEKEQIAAPNAKGSDGVDIASEWKRSYCLPFLTLVLALCLQLLVCGAAVYLSLHNFIVPVGPNIRPGLSLYTYNILISIMGSLVGLGAGMSLAIGAQSFLTHKLLGSGVTPLGYQAFVLVGLGKGTVKIRPRTFIPNALVALLAASHSTFTGIFQGYPDERPFALNFQYPNQSIVTGFYLENNQSIGGYLYNAQDFSAFAQSAGDTLNQKLSTAQTNLTVDTINIFNGGGNCPVSYIVSRIASDAYNTTILPDINTTARAAIKAGTQYVIFDAPVGISNATCQTFNPISDWPYVDRGISQLSFDAGVCGQLNFTYPSSSNAVVGGTFSCLSSRTQTAIIGYFYVNPGKQLFIPVSTCSLTTRLATMGGLEFNLTSSRINFHDVRSSPSSLGAVEAQDATVLAQAVLDSTWISPSKFGGLPELAYYLQAVLYQITNNNNTILDGHPTNYQLALKELEFFSETLFSLSIAKIFNSAIGNIDAGMSPSNRFMVFPAYTPTGQTPLDATLPLPGPTASPTVAATPSAATVSPVPSIPAPKPAITSNAVVYANVLVIGPSGHRVIFLAVQWSVLLCLVTCVIITVKYVPTIMDPLDPLGALLIAQNSPPTPAAEGGGTGNVKKIRSDGEKIKYRVVSHGHLGFGWGKDENWKEDGDGKPKLGHKYV